jgi:hypothetical protein
VGRKIAFAWLAAALLAGCSGGGATSTSPAPVCPALAISDSQAHLVNPASGATGVSPSIGTIAVAYGNAAVLDSVTLTPNDGSAAVGGTPSFTGTLPPSGTVNVTIPALKPATTYTVAGRSLDFAHMPCFVPTLAAFGSFTTQ